MIKQSRLQFTEEERADPTLEKSIAKSEKAADKVEQTQIKIPKKTVKTKEHTFDAETGKAKVRLHFEEVDKPKPPSKLEHNIKKAPQRATLSTIHKNISKYEQDNVGLEAAHGTEKTGEFTVRRVQSAYHSKIRKQIDTSTLDRELKNYEIKLREVDLNKTRLENEIDSLPEDTRFRERKLHDMTLRLDGLYDTIVELEEKIEDVKLRRKAVEQDAITLENIYTPLANFDKVYDKISDEEKKIPNFFVNQRNRDFSM